MPNPTLSSGIGADNASVPYYLTANAGIPNIGITETGSPALSNAQLVVTAQRTDLNNASSGSFVSKIELGQPLGWFMGIAIVVLLLSWLNQSSWVKGTPSPIKPSLTNTLFIGLMSILFISGSKVLLTKYPVPGLSTLISGV